MTLAKNIASHLLVQSAVYLKPEGSGIKSPIYTDNRVTLCLPRNSYLDWKMVL